MRGKLITIEGTDCSGKSTQLALLCERLEREGVDFMKVAFPRYDSDSSALVRMYLGGEFGENVGAVNAFAASSFFAVDRVASYLREWKSYLDNGGKIGGGDLLGIHIVPNVHVKTSLYLTKSNSKS